MNESNRLAKECIVIALIELMKVRDYDSITITEITRKAGVSRMAYYRNYTSKDDILNKFIEEAGESIHSIVENHRADEEVYDYCYLLFDQLGRYNDIGMVTYKANLGELILSAINKFMLKTYPPSGAPDEKAENASRYRRYFFAGAFFNVFTQWIKNGMRESPAEMAEICRDMTLNGCHPIAKSTPSPQ